MYRRCPIGGQLHSSTRFAFDTRTKGAQHGKKKTRGEGGDRPGGNGFGSFSFFSFPLWGFFFLCG